MRLNGLIELIATLPGFESLERRLSDGETPDAVSLLEGAKPLLLTALWRRSGRPLLAITARSEDARRLHEQLLGYAGDDAAVRLLPEPDELPFERLVSERPTVHERLGVLANLANPEQPLLVVASAYAATAKTLSPDELRAGVNQVERGATVDLMSLLRRWTSLGYRTEAAVEVPGTMSRRGGILDVYPPTAVMPVRIELFGNSVESIRFFDPHTQRSAEMVQSIEVGPASEVLGGHTANGVPDLDGLNPESHERMAEDLRRLVAGDAFDDIEFYRGVANQATALDFLSGDGTLVVDEMPRIRRVLEEMEKQAGELHARLAGEGELPLGLPGPQMTFAQFQKRARATDRRLELDAFLPDSAYLPFTDATAYAGRTRILLTEIGEMLDQGQRIVVVSQQAPRLQELFEEAGIPTSVLGELPTLPERKSISLVHGSLAEGWTLSSEATTLFSDAELFGLTKQRRHVRRRPAQHQSFLSDLTVGDYVVHIDHGIGRFTGTIVRQEGDRAREFLTLEYASNDRLLVPTEQVDRVGPYVGASGRPPALSRLGTQEWNRLKERVKASTAQVARDLISLYAAREVVVGRASSPDTPWQQELEASFPFVETTDQLRTIHEVKADMERPKPMDRVITGDVGYGKTEVALRCAFKSVSDGAQVALLVPTTVLAQQHFTTFSERLSPFPVKIAMLSRFRSDREQQEIVEGLADGSVDICIGTHRLVQKDIRFKNLGLVIIDEEQRFGVQQKERLKQLRQQVDVLSMSATPIPRTLYMALAGVRDMSVMETPPEERLPIKTYVAQYDGSLIREAMLREMERGGQVFFVHNRVRNIEVIAERLRKLVPEVTIAIAHGQMPEDRLEKVMLEFAEGKANVLLCTTIIESGLDMPNVNTLIVNDSDRMGLSQLYQLRGRVGRGATRAYAYFLYAPDKSLTETSEKRLRTILSATELGAGFRIAMKDLEIRGAGNILGVEQHGHIAAVGFDMYLRLLSEAVEALKAGEAGEDGTVATSAVSAPQLPSVDLPITAHLPESYVSNLGARLAIYQRMAALREPTDLDDLADELKDRFGDWPEEVENLLFMLKVKLLALRARVLSVSQQTGEIVLAGDEKTWVGLLGVQRPYGDGVRIGHTRVRLDVKRLGKNWRKVLEKMLTQASKSAA